LLLNDLEKHYIKFYGTYAATGHGYNATEGGDTAAWVRSEETRAKMSMAKKGKPGGRKGSVASDETRKRLSESHKGKIPTNLAQLAELSRTRIRKPVTEETRAKMSESHKGVAQSADTVLKRCRALTGQKRSPEARERMRQVALVREAKKREATDVQA
jgi:hypothetical protein